MNSSAVMDNTSCRWINESSSADGGWCEWAFDDVPPGQGGEGIIHNVWLSVDRVSPDYQSVIDEKCFSGNCGSIIAPGSYYVMLHMGDTMVNVTINGSLFATIDNTQGFWQDIATNLSFNFSNGTWQIEVIDLIGPDYINWFVDIGQAGSSGNASGNESGSGDASVLILDPADGAVVTENITVVYNLSGNLSGYNATRILLDTFVVVRTDPLGLNNYTFVFVPGGEQNISVELLDGADQPIDGDYVIVTVNESGNGSGIGGNVSGSPPYQNVLIEVYDDQDQLVSVNRSDINGSYAFALEPGTYTVEFILDDQCSVSGQPCPESGTVIVVEGVVVSDWTDLGIHVPHIGYDVRVNDTPINYSVTPLFVNTTYAFIMVIDNQDNFTISNPLLGFNATDGMGHWGAQTVFTDTVTQILPGTNETLTVPFYTDSPPLVRTAEVVVDLSVPMQEVVVGSVTPSQLEVSFETLLDFNITEGSP